MLADMLNQRKVSSKGDFLSFQMLYGVRKCWGEKYFFCIDLLSSNNLLYWRVHKSRTVADVLVFSANSFDLLWKCSLSSKYWGNYTYTGCIWVETFLYTARYRKTLLANTGCHVSRSEFQMLVFVLVHSFTIIWYLKHSGRKMMHAEVSVETKAIQL